MRPPRGNKGNKTAESNLKTPLDGKQAARKGRFYYVAVKKERKILWWPQGVLKIYYF